jgi:biopolymer transport protein ExbD
MSMDVGKRGGLNADINVTPLVDVMLVLLIIMMLVAPMLQQGVAVTMPSAENVEQKPDSQEQTVLAIDSQNRFYVNGLEVAKTEMADRIKTVLEDKRERVVFIKADQDASYSAVMFAMDDLRKAQIEDIGLITERKRAPGALPTGGK